MGRKRYYANSKQSTTLTSNMTNTQTSMVVASVTGLPTRFPYVLTIAKNKPAEAEAVLVTAASGTTLTVTRGFDDTGSFAHAIGDIVSHDHVAADYNDVQDSAGFHRTFLYGGY